MKKLMIVIPFFLLVVFPQLVISGLSEEEKRICEEPASVAEERRCEEIRFRDNDQELNRVYNELIEKMNDEKTGSPENASDEHIEKLVEAQRIWGEMRDAECGFLTHPNEGAGSNMFYNMCLSNLTIKRTETLKEYLELWPDIYEVFM